MDVFSMFAEMKKKAQKNEALASFSILNTKPHLKIYFLLFFLSLLYKQQMGTAPCSTLTLSKDTGLYEQCMFLRMQLHNKANQHPQPVCCEQRGAPLQCPMLELSELLSSHIHHYFKYYLFYFKMPFVTKSSIICIPCFLRVCKLKKKRYG